MLSPDQVVTAPPLKRSPQFPPHSNPNDLHNPWEEFASQIFSECSTTATCWLSAFKSAEPFYTPPCSDFSSKSCRFSAFSSAFVMYTSLYPEVRVTETTSPRSTSATSHDSPPSPIPSTSGIYTAQPTTAAETAGAGTTMSGTSHDDVSAPTSFSGSGPDSALETGTSTETASPTVAQSGGSSSSANNKPAVTPKPVSVSKSSNNTGAIAGGVIGGLLFIAFLVALAFFIRRRRRRARIPPSAEFMHMAREGAEGPELAFVSFDPDGRATPARLIPLARQSSIEDDERPPAFTPGSYSDPILEKVHASAAMRDQYGVGHEEGGFEAY
ncbi:hypothetical protein BD311DRAFT_775429 [Dichomitus squalens]|uniref:Uncharacterized protein n=1 Tax=Dichomitus squalens TaxID=114155 RepID=A0A4Q9MY78_9APHY|nr:hypothetical protein BD311DRAFT_775429 [Dichomitus squalens]